METKLLILDLDGVLIDTKEIHFLAFGAEYWTMSLSNASPWTKYYISLPITVAT